MPARLKLDHAGIAAVLKSAEVGDAVASLADKVAARVRDDAAVRRNGVEGHVVVDEYTTDRSAASVTITHPAGLPLEAKHGVLTRAAGDEGLEVRSRPHE